MNRQDAKLANQEWLKNHAPIHMGPVALEATGLRLGLLITFNVTSLRHQAGNPLLSTLGVLGALAVRC